jgi:hypothetical protein
MTIAEMNNQTEIEDYTRIIFTITNNIEKNNIKHCFKDSYLEYNLICLLELINEDPAYKPAPELLVDEEQPKFFSTPEFVKELKVKAEYISKRNIFSITPKVKTGIEVLCYQIYHKWDGIVLDVPADSEYYHFGNRFLGYKKKDLANILKENKVKGRSKCKTLEEMAKLCMSF